MSQVMNPQEVMRISILGYNFADWVKQFKEAFKKSDGTYDYMAYLAQLNNPSGFFLLKGSIGSDETNDFLNSLLTPTLDRIEIVGGMGQKGGGILTIIILLLILNLFAAAIQSSLITNTAAKAELEFRNANRDVNPHEDIKKPETVEGWLWNTEPTDKQMKEYKKAVYLQDQLRTLMHNADLEAETNKQVILREQDRKDAVAAAREQLDAELRKRELDFKIEQEKSKTNKDLEELRIKEKYTKKELTEAEKRNDALTAQFEKVVREFTDLQGKWKDSFMETELWKRNCLLLGFAGCFGYIVSTQMQRTRKNYMIGPQYLIPKMQGLIVMGINNGNIVQVYNPETGTKNYWTNQATIDQLSAALGLMVGNMLQAASIGNNNNNNNDGNGAGALGYDPSMRSSSGALGYDPSMRSSSGALGYDPSMRRRGGRKTRRLKKLKKINNKTR
jgi:hypothetical protein